MVRHLAIILTSIFFPLVVIISHTRPESIAPLDFVKIMSYIPGETYNPQRCFAVEAGFYSQIQSLYYVCDIQEEIGDSRIEHATVYVDIHHKITLLSIRFVRGQVHLQDFPDEMVDEVWAMWYNKNNWFHRILRPFQIILQPMRISRYYTRIFSTMMTSERFPYFTIYIRFPLPLRDAWVQDLTWSGFYASEQPR